ncbi:MAG: Gfo/Idh/MocA family oxidoreductase [Planctomycetaceae bacterium]|nr:Gfo/Idh/MocA family oxidoreductase [Planctomycetaceae bacterium]
METKLRFGMVGGGNGGNIGNSHRRGALMDSLAVLTAGSFTRDGERNRRDGERWGVPADRIYSDYAAMAEEEGRRPDGIDFVSIVTPNASHYPVAKCFLAHGINVVCEKPFTLSVPEAEELRRLAAEKNLEICVTYTYAHYPIMRECRHLVESGRIGRIIDIVAEYPQDWMILGLSKDADNFTKWIGDPATSGNSNVTAAMGVNLNYLITAMTGLELESVLAHFGYYPEDAPLETTARIFLRYKGGAGGLAWTSNVAIGHDCTIDLKLYGDKGSIRWSHEDPTRLTVSYLGGPVEILAANRDYLDEWSREASRLPAGHPEGFYEAFANIYREFCRHLLDKKNGAAGQSGDYFYPKARDGVDGVRFVHACVRSQQTGNAWTNVADG